MTQSAVATPVSAGAVCALHPERPATATCMRCGRFACADETRLVHDRSFCADCAVRPDVDYLEAFRLRCWGKRDVWAVLAGMGAVVELLIVATAVAERRDDAALVIGGISLLFGVVSAGYFFGKRWARYGSVFAPLVPLVVIGAIFALSVWLASPESEKRIVDDFVELLLGYTGLMLVPTLMNVAIFFDTRNRLFFKVPVSEKRLRAAWSVRANNAIARRGLLLSLLGFTVPGLSVISLVCALIGLRRVDPGAFPPVGRKGQAIAGVVLSLLGIAGWSALWAASA